jgi:hypothetical protein
MKATTTLVLDFYTMGVLKIDQWTIVVNDILRMQSELIKKCSSIGSGCITSDDSRFRRSHSHPCSVGRSMLSLVAEHIQSTQHPGSFVLATYTF